MNDALTSFETMTLDSMVDLMEQPERLRGYSDPDYSRPGSDNLTNETRTKILEAAKGLSKATTGSQLEEEVQKSVYSELSDKHFFEGLSNTIESQTPWQFYRLIERARNREWTRPWSNHSGGEMNGHSIGLGISAILDRLSWIEDDIDSLRESWKAKSDSSSSAGGGVAAW